MRRFSTGGMALELGRIGAGVIWAGLDCLGPSARASNQCKRYCGTVQQLKGIMDFSLYIIVYRDRSRSTV